LLLIESRSARRAGAAHVRAAARYAARQHGVQVQEERLLAAAGFIF